MPDRPRSRGPTVATDCLRSTVSLRAARLEGFPLRRTTTRTRRRRHHHLWPAIRTRLSGARTVTARRSTVLRFRPPTCRGGDSYPASSQLCVLACLSQSLSRTILYLDPRRVVCKTSFSGFFDPSFSCVCSTIPRASTCIPRFTLMPFGHGSLPGLYAPNKRARQSYFEEKLAS